jgi:hypothetical protein
MQREPAVALPEERERAEGERMLGRRPRERARAMSGFWEIWGERASNGSLGAASWWMCVFLFFLGICVVFSFF